MVETGTLCGKKWQSMLKNGKERMQYLYTSSTLSDVDIFFPEDEEPVKVHSLVLSTNSPVFFALLNGPLATGEELTLPEDPRQYFQKLLDHMYLDRMDLESVEEALKVYALTRKYEMESATRDCVKYIIASNVKAETMPEVLETSVLYGDAALKKKCKEILDRDPDAVMLPETVSRLSKGCLRALLTDETLAFSSEVVPFRGLIAWGKAQLGQQEEPSGSALREEIGDDLLREVRFLDMSCDEFFDHVVGTDVLTHTECIHIQCAIRGADPSKFPMTTPLHPARGRRKPPKEDEALKKKCKEILDRDPDAVMLPETVSRLSKGCLRALLTDETLAFSSEVVPFRGLIAWGKAQLGQQEEPSGSALREEIGDDLLREVRFLDMSRDEFFDNVVGTDVLTHTECIHILTAIRGADPSKLPRTTPLHPARGGRRGRILPKWRLSSFHLSPDGDSDIEAAFALSFESPSFE
ncbi:BTB/POZ domain-containing protein 6-like [Oratosquilla oratoria]|uniref:BTB/POZ domain-containing protein 6-like n=1 Tax=Oratosquilla oratoria TaxID=337810 RepID=UPI003F762EC3